MPGYRKYLQSEHWKAFRLKALERASYACQLCNRKQKDGVTLHVHHRSYTRIGHEDEMDVVVLCSECHKKFHGINEDNKITCMTSKPKTMGGKQPYLMVMINEIEAMKKSEFTAGDINEQIGYLCCLGKNIEWNTGKLINTKTKQALKYNDLMKLFKCSNKKLNRLIGQMKENEIIYGTAQGYFVSRRFIKKGKKEGGC